ncbi:BlaI/MecI/CopY family transcriptional regulator [Saprospira grandis]|nr:BlaI/MecI/CopY family transcriptional regulator [Saprospira grandis]EJF54262.1 putative transcriptional regulator [Saprospira grandis DSM 2844]
MEKKIMLTPLELKVMDILWKLERAYIKDILAHWPEASKPAYNTVSTIVRILQDKKKYIGHMEKGRSHQYYPLVSKESYQQDFLENAVEKVFSGSVQSLLSALIEQENMTDAELEELKKLLDR